jgi:hypothetical protein
MTLSDTSTDAEFAAFAKECAVQELMSEAATPSAFPGHTIRIDAAHDVFNARLAALEAK